MVVVNTASQQSGEGGCRPIWRVEDRGGKSVSSFGGSNCCGLPERKGELVLDVV